MAKLPEAARAEAWSEWMRENDEDTSLTKSPIRDVINKADDFLDNNFDTFNASLPESTRNAMTRGQKMRALSITAEVRHREGA